MCRVITRFLLLCVLLLAGVANAGFWSLAAKGSKTAAKGADVTVATAGAARRMTQQQFAGLAGLGAGVVYLDVTGGRVLLRAVESGAEAASGGMDDLGRLVSKAPVPKGASKPRIVLDDAGVEELGDRMRALSRQSDLLVAHPKLGLMRVLELPGPSGAALYKELRPGLVTPIQSRIPDEIADALLEPFMKENLFVAAMFSRTDVDSLRGLAAAAGDRITDGSKVAALDSKWLRDMRGKTVIVAGHVENGRFVARGPAGEIVHTVSLEDLEAAAAAHNFRILSAGCSSYCAGAGAGFAEAVTDAGVTAGIAAAFEARTTADLLAAMGRSSPLVVSESTLHDFARTQILHAAALERHSGAVRAAGYSIRFKGLAQAAAKSELLEVLGGWLMIGAAAMLVMIRTSRAAFLRVFPTLPSAMLAEQRTRYVLAWSARELLFLTAGPLFAAVTVFTFFFGGWPHRLDIQVFFWTFLRHPLSSAFKLVLLLLGGIIIIGVYVACVSLLIAPGVGLTSWALSSFDGALFWLLAAVCLAYWVTAGWLGMRMHRKFRNWLNARAETV